MRKALRMESLFYFPQKAQIYADECIASKEDKCKLADNLLYAEVYILIKPSAGS